MKSQAGNLSHRGKVSKETEIELQGDKVLHHFWSKPVDLRAFLPRPAPQNFVLAPPRPAEIWAAPIIPDRDIESQNILVIVTTSGKYEVVTVNWIATE